MELYLFVRGLLAWIVTIACCLPLSVPLLALSFKIQVGARPLPLTREALWWRSIFAAIFLGLVCLGFLILDYILVDWAGFPAGLAHLVIFMAYVPVAVWILTIMYAYTDLLEGLSLFTIFTFLPMFVLFVLNLIPPGIWNTPLSWAYEWLAMP